MNTSPSAEVNSESDKGITDAAIAQAAGRLREVLAEMKKSETWKQIVEPRDAVFARFQPIFQPAYIQVLTAEELRPFFYFENNHHWTGLFRQVNRVCSDMPRLREVLLKLTDETRAIEDRLDEVGGVVVGLGKAIITAILTVGFPAKYGVWNNVSEGGLIKLGIFPDFERGVSFGARYSRINAILRRLADTLSIDLWTLDALWWQLGRGNDPPVLGAGTDASIVEPQSATSAQFGLERHLHDFLYDNWAHTELGRDWEIFAQPGEPDAGYEYACPVGKIDILARHRTEKKWLVVELKRNNTSDSVVGQILRYMGWVRQHVAEPGDKVHGLIIARIGDFALQYAISAVPELRFMTYKVGFELIPASLVSGASSQ
jgi:hypothetical protein